mmetsp:Transcript_35897/g.107196  ORF Transcript_35897/g.107196 Transcript_35897/m.107196 type:complete len:408 (-) Transcript_35897:495-1718(-)
MKGRGRLLVEILLSGDGGTTVMIGASVVAGSGHVKVFRLVVVGTAGEGRHDLSDAGAEGTGQSGDGRGQDLGGRHGPIHGRQERIFVVVFVLIVIVIVIDVAILGVAALPVLVSVLSAASAAASVLSLLQFLAGIVIGQPPRQFGLDAERTERERQHIPHVPHGIVSAHLDGRRAVVPRRQRQQESSGDLPPPGRRDEFEDVRPIRGNVTECTEGSTDEGMSEEGLVGLVVVSESTPGVLGRGGVSLHRPVATMGRRAGHGRRRGGNVRDRVEIEIGLEEVVQAGVGPFLTRGEGFHHPYGRGGAQLLLGRLLRLVRRRHPQGRTEGAAEGGDGVVPEGLDQFRTDGPHPLERVQEGHSVAVGIAGVGGAVGVQVDPPLVLHLLHLLSRRVELLERVAIQQMRVALR